MNVNEEIVTLDEEVFSELKDLMADDFDVLVDTFLLDSVELMRQLTKAFVDHDGEAVKRVAHTLCGSSGNFGFVRFSALCKQMEIAILDNDFPQAQSFLKPLQAEFEEIKSFFAQQH